MVRAWEIPRPVVFRVTPPHASSLLAKADVKCVVNGECLLARSFLRRSNFLSIVQEYQLDLLAPCPEKNKSQALRRNPGEAVRQLVTVKSLVSPASRGSGPAVHREMWPIKCFTGFFPLRPLVPFQSQRCYIFPFSRPPNSPGVPDFAPE